jgi:hypothetical protein
MNQPNPSFFVFPCAAPRAIYIENLQQLFNCYQILSAVGVFQRDHIDLMTFDVYMMLMFSHFIGSCDPLGIFQQIALNFHHPLKVS